MKSMLITSRFHVRISISLVISPGFNVLPLLADNWDTYPQIMVHSCGSWINRISGVVGSIKNLLFEIHEFRNL